MMLDDRPIEVGSIITNGFQAMRTVKYETRHKTWRTSGWTGIRLALEPFGGSPGMFDFVPDRMIETSWYHLPFEWTPCRQGSMEERYVWDGGHTWLRREVRTIPIPGQI